MSKIKTDWQKIYRENSPILLGICRRYIQDIYAAEDIVQDSFIVALQNKHQLRDEKLLFAWLKKIVVNNALQYLRKSSKETFITTEPSEIPDTLSEMNHPSLDEKIFFLYDFTRDQLLSSIDSLPEHHKSVFNLFFIENHSHTEISGMLGITVNTSKSHLLRAKKSIQNYLLGTVDHNTPKNKKKITQLLVFFGFGGLLWAQTFRSKFLDYSITPSKIFEISQNISIKTPPPMVTSQTWKKKVIMSSTILLIIIASIFIVRSKKSFHSKEIPIITSDKVLDKETETTKVTSQNVKKNSTPIDHSFDKTLDQISSKVPNVEVHVISKEKSSDSKEKSKKVIPKDSIQEPSKKVIVVKKIIQRDTIFVER